jgi:hypothetical protein
VKIENLDKIPKKIKQVSIFSQPLCDLWCATRRTLSSR